MLNLCLILYTNYYPTSLRLIGFTTPYPQSPRDPRLSYPPGHRTNSFVRESESALPSLRRALSTTGRTLEDPSLNAACQPRRPRRPMLDASPFPLHTGNEPPWSRPQICGRPHPQASQRPTHEGSRYNGKHGISTGLHAFQDGSCIPF